MAIVRVNSISTTGTSPASSQSSGSINITAGNLLIVIYRSNGTISGVSDTAGNTFTLAAQRDDNTAGIGRIRFWYAWNCLGSTTNNVTVTGTSMDFRQIDVIQYSGIQTSSDPRDVTTSEYQSTSAFTFTSTTFTTAQAEEVVVACGTGNSGPTYTAGASYTLLPSLGIYTGVQERITSSILTSSTSSMTSTSNQLWYYFNVSFRGAGAAASKNNSLLRLGVG